VHEDDRLAVRVTRARDMRVEAIEGDESVLDTLDLNLLGQLDELSLSDRRARV
jgi:hypothetical protein